jgi:hypothetical protein
MKFGRLIRVSKHRSDQTAVVYVVAEPEPDKAIAIVRKQAGNPGDDVEDLGRVTDTLLSALNLSPGQCIRT